MLDRTATASATESKAGESKDGESKDIVSGLVHGMAVLKAFSGSTSRSLTQAEVSAQTGLTRATARRSLLTLEALGYVHAEAGRYRLSPKVIELAAGYFANAEPWIATAQPYLEVLRDKVEENVSAAVLDRTEVVYVASYTADTVMAINVRVGGRKPAFCTAMGRVLLAAMPDACVRDVLAMSDRRQRTAGMLTDIEALMDQIRRVRDQGFAVIDQELEPGLVAVAVPLKNARGEVLAAINICGHTMQTSLEKLVGTCLPEALAAAARIAAHLP